MDAPRAALVPLVFLSLALAACGGGEDAGGEGGAEGAEDAPSVGPATSEGELEEQAVVLQAGRTPDGRAYLTDVDEMALYLFTADSAGRSTCFDACAEVWPPVVGPSATVASGAATLESDLVGTVERRDGQLQVTYGGHPLYYYAEDSAPGDITGQDVHDHGGEWYLVTPEGTALESPEGEESHSAMVQGGGRRE